MSPARNQKKKDRLASTGDTLHPQEPRAKQLPLPWPFSPDVTGDHAANGVAPVLTVYTIGHSNHQSDAFLALLRQHRLETLVDVRSAPYSRFAPHFSQGALQALLDAAGIGYVWAGETLGGRPDDPACYRDGIVRQGHVDYAAMAGRRSYRLGVQQLLARAADGPIVVMCSEEDPRRCHRHHLIEHSLHDHGVSVLHIRRDGIVETIDPEERVNSASPIAQLLLRGFDA